jgi:heterotetrameric sarcosine oxidase gamma subunit
VADTKARVTPIAHSPIKPEPPLIVIAGWQVSAPRRTTGELTITDCTPLTKVQLRATTDMFGVRHGQAARRTDDGTLIASSGPGEWLLLAAPGESKRLLAEAGALPSTTQNELITAVDLTHGRALVRLTGDHAPDVLALLCGIDLSDHLTPDGTAFRTAVAAVATDIIRDDRSTPRSTPRRTRSYLLHCERSAGQYLFDSLRRAGTAAGHSIEVAGFDLPGSYGAF